MNLALAVPTSESWFSAKEIVSVIVAFIALAGVIATIIYNGRRQREGLAETARLQREADRRKYETEIELRQETRSHEIMISRSIVFAQLARVYRTIKGEYGYLAHSQIKFVWIAFYTTLLPTSDNLKRVEMLTPGEVSDITAFYYSYHEHMGYIAASGGLGKTSIKFDFHLIGVDFTDNDRELRWLVGSLEVLDRKAAAAMASILEASRAKYGGDSPIVQRLEREKERNDDHARRASSSLTLLQQRATGTA